jgi:sugar fermentation stimulation protein A
MSLGSGRGFFVYNLHIMKNVCGSYILILELKKPRRVKIGSLGFCKFPEGHYFYVGSAKGGIKQRIMRHIRSNIKHWHIDYLKAKAKIIGAIIIEDSNLNECTISSILRKRYEAPVKNFGSSDCLCTSHLFLNPIFKSGLKSLTEYLNASGIEFTLKTIKSLLSQS